MTSLYPAIEPYRSGWLDVGDATKSILKSRVTPRASPVYLSTAAPVAVLPRKRASSSTPSAIALWCLTSGVAASPDPMRHWRPTPPGTWSPTWNSCAGNWASNAGWFLAAPGAYRLPMPRPTPRWSRNWYCGAYSCCVPRRSTGSTSTAPVNSTPTAGSPTWPPSRKPNGTTCCRLSTVV